MQSGGDNGTDMAVTGLRLSVDLEGGGDVPLLHATGPLL